MPSQCIRHYSWSLPRYFLLLGASFGMSLVSAPGSAQQRALPVVAVQCDAELGLCRALVQALAETVPALLYRINPSPIPSQAFKLRLNLDGHEGAHLSWQGGGKGETVTRSSHDHTQLARQLVTASPGLPGALRAHP